MPGRLIRSDRRQHLGAQFAAVTSCQRRHGRHTGRYLAACRPLRRRCLLAGLGPDVGATPYSTLDGGFGVHSADDAMTVAVRAKNLLNKAVQEHVFGDLITRTVTGEVIFRF